MEFCDNAKEPARFLLETRLQGRKSGLQNFNNVDFISKREAVDFKTS
jgi:hypothetical protein